MSLSCSKSFNQFALLAVSLTIMILSIVALTKVNYTNSSFSNIISNHNTPLVTKVKAEDKTIIPAINFSFEGTRSGCYCSTFFSDRITTGSCSSKKIREGCFDIYALSPKIFHKWKGTK